MPFFEVQRARLRSPPFASAALALCLRTAVVLQGWAANPVVRRPQLDGEYYQRWATDIAGGDLFGTLPGGPLEGGPFFLNPLYAYLVAPFVKAFGTETVLPVLLVQAVLGAVTAALAAAAAGRFFGRTAAWTAGVGVAFSTVLVELDGHFSVSGLAAFLVAGVVFSCAPARDDDPAPGRLGGARGPLASGLWLGLGVLARPVALAAIPFVTLLHMRRAGAGRARWTAALLVIGGFALCAGPNIARNRIVTGEPILFTAANGANFHLGANPAAWESSGMASPHFRFSPFLMHDDAKRLVWQRLGREPTWGEVSAEFKRIWRTDLRNHPGEAAGFYLEKVRWFFGPAEPPSSASLRVDRGFVPLLWMAWVPTWLLAALALVGALVHRRRLDVLLGPGSLVLAHLVATTIVFPLSHYRSPAIPALAVLAGGALQWGLAAWRARRRRTLALAVAGSVAVAVAGALPPQPDLSPGSSLLVVAVCYRDQGAWDLADEYADRASAARAAEHPGSPELPGAWFVRGYTSIERARSAATPDEAQRHYREAIRHYGRGLATDTENWLERLTLVVALLRVGEPGLALAQCEVIFRQQDIETDPGRPETWKLPPVHARYGETLVALRRFDEARPHLEFAIRFARERRDVPADWALPPDLLARARAKVAELR